MKGVSFCDPKVDERAWDKIGVQHKIECATSSCLFVVESPLGSLRVSTGDK